MQISVITDNGEFYQRVFHACRRLIPAWSISHHSIHAWQTADLAEVAPQTLLIMNAEEENGLQLPSSGLAWIRLIQHDLAEADTHWECLSWDPFVLRLQSLGLCHEQSPRIVEQCLLDLPGLHETELCVPSCCSLMPGLRDRLLQGIDEFQLASGSAATQFCMALEEAISNAFYHGNLELSSSLKEDGSSRFLSLARARERQQPYRFRTLRITELVTPWGLWLTIEDQGPGFDVQQALDRANDPELMLASGRGLMMMQAFSDELFFNRRGNMVTLVLYARTSSSRLREDGEPPGAAVSREVACAGV